MDWVDNNIESDTELIFYYVSTILTTLLGGFGVGLALTSGVTSLAEITFLLIMLFALGAGLSSFVVVNNYLGQSYGLQVFISSISLILMFWGFTASSISTVIMSLVIASILSYHTNIIYLPESKIAGKQKKERNRDSSEDNISADVEDLGLLSSLTPHVEEDLEGIDKENLEFVDVYIDDYQQQFCYLSKNISKDYVANICTISKGVNTVIRDKLGLKPSNTIEIEEKPQSYEYYCNSISEVLDIIELSYRVLETDFKYIKLDFNLKEGSNFVKTYSLNTSEPAEDDVNYYIDNFVEEKGRGNEDEREKLVDLVQSSTKINRSRSEILDLVKEKADRREKEAIKSMIHEMEAEELDGYIENFVHYLGKGNKKTISLAAEVLDIPGPKLKEKIESKFNSIRKEKELDQFKSDIGLESKDSSFKKGIDELEHSKIIKNLISPDYSWSEINEMSGLEFEEFIENLFAEMGYQAEQTSKTGDQGADVIAENPSTKIAIQAKNQKSKTSNSAVQEVKAAISYYNCDKGMVISTSSFTNSAKELAKDNNIELWSKKEVEEKKAKYMDENKV